MDMAARGVNKVILIGNLGADPDVRYSASGTAMATLSVATSESWKDKAGEAQEKTEWHRVKCFGKLAEIVGEYLTKGRQVYIEGAIRSDKYQDKNGVERWSFDVVAREVQFLGGEGAQGGAHHSPGRSGARSSVQAPADRSAAPRPAAQREARHPESSRPPADDLDADSIPF